MAVNAACYNWRRYNPPGSTGLPTILAIDNDIGTLSALATSLRGAGYQVQTYSAIDQARHYLDETDPDLILLEVDTDQGAGWALLRDIIRFEGPPTIVVSYHSREEEIVEALRIGAADFLPKPYRTNELVARVQARLGPAPTNGAPKASANGAPMVVRADDGPVFMTHTDEQRLLERQVVVADPEPEEEHLPLGARLHAARQRRKLTLVQANLDTKIPIWYLQAMEDEKFSLLPRGPAAGEMVLAYAEYLRLNGERAMAEYQGHHDAGPFRPLPSLGGSPLPREIPVWMSIAVAAALAVALFFGVLSYFASDQMANLGQNLRNLTGRSAVTTPVPLEPTITPDS